MSHRDIPTGAGEDDSLTGDLDVRSSLLLQGKGQNFGCSELAGLTVIDATGLGDRVLHVKPPESGSDIVVGIDCLTLRGGATSDAGGGLLVQDFRGPEIPSLPPVVFNPITLIEGTVIELNTAGIGGGIRYEHPDGGSSSISRSTIRSNTATGPGAGGIDSFAPSIQLFESAVEANVVTRAGCTGVVCAGGIFDNRSMRIERSTIADNQSTSGPGGIGAGNDALSILNSTISGNRTSGPAGGLAVGDAANAASVDVRFATITGNGAGLGGGVRVGPHAGAQLTIGASVVAGNSAPTNADVDGSVLSSGDNLVGDAGTSTGFTGPGDRAGTTASPIDAMLGPLARNGGQTRTHPPLPASPVLDATDCLGIDADQREVRRPFGGACDVGAYESTDPDDDGIDAAIDGTIVSGSFVAASTVFSNDFTNDHLSDGRSFGTILDRGGLFVRVWDADAISADFSGFESRRLGVTAFPGTGTAQIQACDSPVEHLDLTGGDSGLIDCSSLTLQVLVGPIEMVLGGDVTVIVPTGATATVTELGENEFAIESAASSSGPIIIEGPGGMIELGPGETFSQIGIDVKPGGLPNSIQLNKKGVVSVAILTTPSLDARTIDPPSVCFGDAEDASQRDCTETHGKGHLEDVDLDLDLDLVLHYEALETGIDHGDTQACLTGQMTGGVAIGGCDSVAPKR